MYFGLAEGGGVGPCHGSQAVYMSKAQVLNLPACLCPLSHVHGSDMLMFHPPWCEEVKFLSYSLAGLDNSWSETSKQHEHAANVDTEFS